uniref:Uncharacterized protein n=1 Tax=Arundo donax TaxID=35708 RepID=A0A0A9ENZ7_ARUDO
MRSGEIMSTPEWVRMSFEMAFSGSPRQRKASTVGRIFFSRSTRRAHGLRLITRQMSPSVPMMPRRNLMQGRMCLSRLRARMPVRTRTSAGTPRTAKNSSLGRRIFSGSRNSTCGIIRSIRAMSASEKPWRRRAERTASALAVEQMRTLRETAAAAAAGERPQEATR